VDLLAVASALGQGVAHQGVTTDAEALFQINLFQVIIAAANFVIFIAIIWKFAFTPISKMLGDRKDRIEQGLKDAEQARLDRENAEAGRIAALQEARREANDILTRAQKVAEDSRERDLAATREELERLRARASAELESEKQRAIADLRAEVADLALRAAGKVIGETMTDDRQRRLVQEFLSETSVPASPKERKS
jgi:F-type H+-transporting ATPase subunit b